MMTTTVAIKFGLYAKKKYFDASARGPRKYLGYQWLPLQSDLEWRSRFLARGKLVPPEKKHPTNKTL